MRVKVLNTVLVPYLLHRVILSGIIHACFSFVGLVIQDVCAWWLPGIFLSMSLMSYQTRWTVSYLIYCFLGRTNMSPLPLDLLAILAAYYVVTVHLLPLALARYSTLRCAVISPLRLTLEGIEWSTRRAARRLPPSLRLDEVYLGRGRSRSAASGIFVLVVKGVTVRIDHWRKANGEQDDDPATAKRMSWVSSAIGSFTFITNAFKALAVWVLSLIIHHYPFVARVFSVEAQDIRIIVDSMDGLEVTIDNVHLGLRILFDPSANPLNSASSSSDKSPTASRQSTSPSSTAACPSPRTTAPSKKIPNMEDLRRPAFGQHSRIAWSLSSIWSRAIGRAEGQIAMLCVVQDIAMMLPALGGEPSNNVLAAGKSHANGKATNGSGLRRRRSGLGVKMVNRPTPRPRAYSSMQSIKALVTGKYPDDSSRQVAYEQLVSIAGESALYFGLGFGPKQGLLGEDTLRSELNLGELRASTQAGLKIKELAQEAGFSKSSADKQPSTPPSERWAPTATARLLLRAVASAAVSFEQVTISHDLQAAGTDSSANSSQTDLTASTSDEDLTVRLILDVANPVVRLSAADASNNRQARNAFGTNFCPASRIRGVAFNLDWNTWRVQCGVPGDGSDEPRQMIEISKAGLRGFSSWRPTGWTREELLFPGDPNLSLVVCQAQVAAIDFDADWKTLSALLHARRKESERREEIPEGDKAENDSLPASLLPRVRAVLDIGPLTGTMTDEVISGQQSTLRVSSESLHIGCFSSFSDIAARRRDRASTRVAFQEEESLQNRRAAAEEEGEEIDYAQLESALPSRLRRRLARTAGALLDDYSLSMRMDALLKVEPIEVRLSSQDTKGGAEAKNHHLATVGRLRGEFSGDMLGKQVVAEDGTETSVLDRPSLSGRIDLGLEDGVRADLADMAVIEVLEALGKKHRQSSQDDEVRASVSPKKNPLARLPSGIAARLSIGLISIAVAHEDPNPRCDLKLIRGLWFRTCVHVEYAHYNNKVQAAANRHVLSAPSRIKLHLPEDVTAQALAHYRSLGPQGGEAALVCLTVKDTYVKPIFNGQRFMANGGAAQHFDPGEPPQPRKDDGYVGWEFDRPKPKTDLRSGKFANQISPFEISDTDQAQRALLKIPRVSASWLIQRDSRDAPVEHHLSANIEYIGLVADLSHVYCSMIAGLTAHKLARAWKRPKAAPSPGREPLRFSLDIKAPCTNIHIALPLGEQLIAHFGTVHVSKEPESRLAVMSDQILALVPSVRQVGSWEELVRIRQLRVSPDLSGDRPAFDIDAGGLRVRIPHEYHMSQLILNFNLSIKSIKLMTDNLRSGKFSFSKLPSAEAAKRVPKMNIRIKHISLEAKDSPIETSLNLMWRAGLVEQERRNEAEDNFALKVELLQSQDLHPTETVEFNGRQFPKLTNKATVSAAEARYRLDWYQARAWAKRIRLAKRSQQKREMAALRHLAMADTDLRLPIKVVTSQQTAPLVRLAMEGVHFAVSSLAMNRAELIDYMGKASASPFDPDQEFSLLVPIDLTWTMDEAKMTLRDYPLPLIRVPPVDAGEKRPAWHVSTPFIIAEELVDNEDDSIVKIKCQVIPPGCGHEKADGLCFDVAKTIMPVKTYARPEIKVASKRTTEFTWGHSYQPAIQDFMKVIETLTHPPRDPSPRVGFWDKFRLVLQWTVTMDFVGPVHLHMKGTMDPYNVSGEGAGFAFAWRHNARFEIGVPNAQYETIQIHSEELLVAIPDLSALEDKAATGAEANQADTPGVFDSTTAEHSLIEKRYSKPCARFMNGVRVGFGFRFEHTCRPWNCPRNCGSTMNLLHRECRFFDSIPHQKVILRSEQAVERLESKLGRPWDSYEGFRSDFVHFSVSVVNPDVPEGTFEAGTQCGDKRAEDSNSFHFSPKSTAAFLAWWRLFHQGISLPIRQGKLFAPNAPPPSKKFGRSLATIKYRVNMAPIFLSHTYAQVTPDLWGVGKTETLGMKLRVGHLRADAHQRLQEQPKVYVRLNRKKIDTHKRFYAADIQVEDASVMGVRAIFDVLGSKEESAEEQTTDLTYHHVSDLPPKLKAWYNFFDFIDADRKPFDHNPKVAFVDIGEIPLLYLAKRVMAQHSSAQEAAESSVLFSKNGRPDIEWSKFGHEKSHICLLGTAEAVGPAQIKLVRQRVEVLETKLASVPTFSQGYEQVNRTALEKKLQTLRKHLRHLSEQENRHLDDQTLHEPSPNAGPAREGDNAESFEYTVHIHNPNLHYNNASRDILYAYWYSLSDRRKECYTRSHRAFEWVAKGIVTRIQNLEQEMSTPVQPSQQSTGAAQAMRHRLEASSLGRDGGSGKIRFFGGAQKSDGSGGHAPNPHYGLPDEVKVKPRLRVLCLKPQIALRLHEDEEAVVLLAMEEVGFKGYQIKDREGTDDISEDIMSRNYCHLKGLQAFYPSERTVKRLHSAFGPTVALDFIPLEILLDVKSEIGGYDRIITQTDAFVSADKFNSIRLPRGLTWPDVQEANNAEISHLRIHQDLISITVPRLTMNATEQHFHALSTIGKKLVNYQDPRRKARTDRIDTFLTTYDRQDRDPRRFLVELFTQQQELRELEAQLRDFETNADRLNAQGKSQLFELQQIQLEKMERLFMIFEAIAINWKRDDARAELITSNRIDICVGNLAWHMMRDDNASTLAKFDITRALLSYVTNKDGTKDGAIVVGDCEAFNPRDGAPWEGEVLTRYYSKSKAVSAAAQQRTFFSCSWKEQIPVGGIARVEHLELSIHPIRVFVEQEIGQAIHAYITGRSSAADDKSADESSGNSGSKEKAVKRPKHQGPADDVSVMRARATANVMFGHVSIGATALKASYRASPGMERVKYVPEFEGLSVKTPEIEYNNKTLTVGNLVSEIANDYAGSLLGREGFSLVGQAFWRSSMFRTKNAIHALGNIERMRSTPSRLISSSMRSSASEPSDSAERTPPETAAPTPAQQSAQPTQAPPQQQQQYSPDGETLVEQDSQPCDVDEDEQEPHSRFVEDLTPTSENGPPGAISSSPAAGPIDDDSDDGHERRPTGVRKSLLNKFKSRHRHSNGSSTQLHHSSSELSLASSGRGATPIDARSLNGSTGSPTRP